MAEKMTKMERHQAYDDILEYCDKIQSLYDLGRVSGTAGTLAMMAEAAEIQKKERGPCL
jgi:hypothetical protein